MLWIVPIFVAVSQGRDKNRMGFAYGFLGWVGVIILALLPPLDVPPDPMIGECPYCKEEIRLDAMVCPHCQREVTPLGPDGQPDTSAWAAEDASA